MSLYTVASRLADGLPLFASTDAGGHETEMMQAKELIKRIDASSPSKMTLDSGPYSLRYVTVFAGTVCTFACFTAPDPTISESCSPPKLDLVNVLLACWSLVLVKILLPAPLCTTRCRGRLLLSA